MELGTIRMVGLLRIFRAYWSRTTPRPCGARPASTSWTGEGPSEGATMAPEICRESSEGGVALDLKKRTAMRPPFPLNGNDLPAHGIRTLRKFPHPACNGPWGLRRWAHAR